MNFDLQNLELMMLAETAAQSGHEERKGRLSMSWLWMDEQEIIMRIQAGCTATQTEKQKLYLGTLCERGIRERLRALCEHAGWQYREGGLLTAYDGKLTGHPDCFVNDVLIEIKTLQCVEHLEGLKAKGRVPFKVYAQMNAYMLWGKYERGICMYEERATGAQWLVEIYPSRKMQEDLKAKAERILSAIENK